MRWQQLGSAEAGHIFMDRRWEHGLYNTGAEKTRDVICDGDSLVVQKRVRKTRSVMATAW